MNDPLLCTMDIGSGPRDPGLINLLTPKPIDAEQRERVVSFVRLVAPELERRYLELAGSPFPGRLDPAKDFLTQLAVETLQGLGYNWVFDMEWPRTEMVDWERADVKGFAKSESWQHSYGFRIWKPSEFTSPFAYSDSRRHIEELERVARFAR